MFGENVPTLSKSCHRCWRQNGKGNYVSSSVTDADDFFLGVSWTGTVNALVKISADWLASLRESD